jgi:prepilin-type N-terminal cleavage/methylation domain-containing protein
MVNPTRRSGYTLFEIVMVLAVVLILSAIAYPSLKSMYGYHKLNGAVDTVKGAWAEARSRAINEGRPYRFSVEPGGTHFRVAPDQEEYWSGNSGPNNDPQGKGMVLKHSLPSGVHFSVNADSSAPPEPVASSKDKDEENSKPSGEWTTGAVFLPNGQARDDVKITFQVRGVQPKALQLRGLTGSVSTVTQLN